MAPLPFVARWASVSAAITFGLLLLLVQLPWSPLIEVDQDTSAGLHAFALQHDTVVSALVAISALGSILVYALLFCILATCLALAGLSRRAGFAIAAMAGTSVLNAV